MCVIMVLFFFFFCLRRSFLLEDRCRFLSNFSLATADMDIPGEYLMPKTMPYYVRIARFMPRVEIVQRHHSTVRRLYIQGDNGKASILLQTVENVLWSFLMENKNFLKITFTIGPLTTKLGPQ